MNRSFVWQTAVRVQAERGATAQASIDYADEIAKAFDERFPPRAELDEMDHRLRSELSEPAEFPFAPGQVLETDGDKAMAMRWQKRGVKFQYLCGSSEWLNGNDPDGWSFDMPPSRYRRTPEPEQ